MNSTLIIDNFNAKIERRLSQGQLNLLQTCPRKFQYTYLENLGSPVTPEQQERMDWGNRFHLLMQQRELGLPVEALIREDPQMERCYSGLLDAAPNIFNSDSCDRTPVFREAEHCRTLNFQGYLLTVFYDLFIADEISAQILDWKTYPLPQNPRWIKQNWQTRLYPFLLAETSNYLPEQISMTYWFVKSAADLHPGSKGLTFSYNDAVHWQNGQDLQALLSQLTEWLQHYEEAGEPFPQVPVETGLCSSCSFAIRCQRTGESGEPAIESDRLPNLADIQEVSL